MLGMSLSRQTCLPQPNSRSQQHSVKSAQRGSRLFSPSIGAAWVRNTEGRHKDPLVCNSYHKPPHSGSVSQPDLDSST